MSDDIVGWFDSPGEIPAHDPGVQGTPCPICHGTLSLEDVRTISLMWPGDTRSFFYRVHKSCHQELSDDDKQALDMAILYSVAVAPS